MQPALKILLALTANVASMKLAFTVTLTVSYDVLYPHFWLSDNRDFSKSTSDVTRGSSGHLPRLKQVHVKLQMESNKECISILSLGYGVKND